MIRLLSHIQSATIHAVDGDMGAVTDCLLTEDLSRVRYLVLDAGNWKPGGRSLVPVTDVAHVQQSFVRLVIKRDEVKKGLMLSGPDTVAQVQLEAGGGRLLSAKRLAGVHAWASDNQGVGHLDDFLVDPVSWAIEGLLIDTSNAPGGKWVTLAPDLVLRIDWGDRKLFLKTTRDRVRNSREYHEGEPVPRL